MRVNSEEAIRRGRAARDKAGSWMELRKTNALRSFGAQENAEARTTPQAGQDSK